MKNILLTSALAATFALALTVSAQAQTNTATATTPAPTTTTLSTSTKTTKTQYAGTITAIAADSVTVAGKSETLTLGITPTTKFHVNHKKADATDFAVGDSITGSYSVDATGAKVANSINKKKKAQ